MTKTPITHVVTVYPGPRVVIFRQERGYRVYQPTRASLVRLSWVLEDLYNRYLVALRSSQRGMLTIWYVVTQAEEIGGLREALRGWADSFQMERRHYGSWQGDSR